MKTNELIEKINGLQTIESIKNILNINRTRAIYLVYKLRKEGYVVTKQDSGNSRIYFISKQNRLGGTSYLDIINKNSPVKLSSSEVYKIYGRKVSIEETIIYAIKTGKFRYILASIGLYKKIKDWKEMYCLAQKNNLVREVGALYDLARAVIPRIKKINRVFEYHALPKEAEKYKYIIPNLKSKDFLPIEEKWKIHLPFNREDLKEHYR
jgi:hypothetical protein